MTHAKHFLAKAAVGAVAAASFVLAGTAAAAGPEWDASGAYVVEFEYLGSDHVHNVTLSQDGDGDLSGSGTSGAYAWSITSGEVEGDTIVFHADYTATADAVTPLTTMHATGTIDTDGTMSGTWSDNYQNGARSGTWETTSGAADELDAVLNAEDFGVVNYDTGLGWLKGYSAGFGLDGATFENVQSVVVKLYSGATLLQTNTGTSKIGDEILGSQISSPFDVTGNFDYVTDGYWTNVRGSEYGQTATATKVVATVVLESGQIVTAENTNLTGAPAWTIMPTSTPSHGNGNGNSAVDRDQCKNGGWKTFTNPSFKNQGQCVSAMNKAN
jgi:hypothetical protein